MLGLFKFYIKAGFYACKPLDYRAQCIIRTFFPAKISVINLEYAFIGHRLNGQWPFYDLFGFDADDRRILSSYTENPIIFKLKLDPAANMTRQVTLVTTDAAGNAIIKQVGYADPNLIKDMDEYKKSLCNRPDPQFVDANTVFKNTSTIRRFNAMNKGLNKGSKKGGRHYSNKNSKKKRKTMKKQRQKKRKTKKMFKT